MKNNLLILIIILLFTTSCSMAPQGTIPNDQDNQDGLTFKNEYEAYNNTFDDKRGYDYINLDIKEDNPIKYAELEEVLNTLENGTGVIYFGFPTCPWCRRVLPYFLEMAEKDGVEEILYFNALDLRDIKELDEQGNVITIQEEGYGYSDILSALGEQAQVYEGLEDESIKRLYFPTIVFVKNGEIIHMNTGTGSIQETPWEPLDEAQIQAINKEFHDAIIRTFREVCDSAC